MCFFSAQWFFFQHTVERVMLWQETCDLLFIILKTVFFSQCNVFFFSAMVFFSAHCGKSHVMTWDLWFTFIILKTVFFSQCNVFFQHIFDKRNGTFVKVAWFSTRLWSPLSIYSTLGFLTKDNWYVLWFILVSTTNNDRISFFI